MDKTIRVGITGGYGMTGQVVAKELAKEKDVSLLVGGRDSAKIKALVSDLGEKAKPFQVDIDNREELDGFCKQCDIIVNCTGPSIVYGEKVARAALKNNCHFIEPGGYEHLMNQLAGSQEEIRRKNLYYVVSCGWIPGISEVFVRFLHEMARQKMDSLETLEHFYGDRNEWSDSGLKDIIWHISQVMTKKESGRGMGVYRKGNWQPVSFGKSSQTVILPEPIGKQKTFSNFANELQQFVRENQEYDLIRSSNIQMSSNTMFAIIGALMFFRNNEAKVVSAVKKAFHNDCQKNRKGGGVVVRIQGKKSGGKQLLTGSFFENKPYWLTGIAPVLAVKMIKDSQMKQTGCNYLCDAVKAHVFMNLLSKAGLQYQLSLNDSKISVEGE